VGITQAIYIHIPGQMVAITQAIHLLHGLRSNLKHECSVCIVCVYEHIINKTNFKGKVS
jgi:hypothetical protein